MPSEILAVGTLAANSTDQVVSAGTPLTVCLKDAAGPSVGASAQVDILLKDDAGQYFQVDSLNAKRPAVMLVAAGTYRFSRVESAHACGVFGG